MQVLTDSDLAVLRERFADFILEVGEDMYELIVARYDAFLHFNNALDGDTALFAAFSYGYTAGIYDSKHNAVGTLQ